MEEPVKNEGTTATNEVVTEIQKKAPEISQNNLRKLDPEEYLETLRKVAFSDDVSPAAGYIDVIIDRFHEELSENGDKEYPARWIAHDIGQETRRVLWRFAVDRDIRVKPELLDKLYTFVDDPNRVVRFHSSEYLSDIIVLDNRNGEESLGLYSRYKKDVVGKLTTPKEDDEVETAIWMVDTAWASFPSQLQPMLIDAMEVAEDDEAIIRAFGIFSNRIGFEEARKLLKSHAQESEDFRPKLEKIEKALDLTRGKVFDDLKRLYDEINFQNYAPNEELIAFERDILMQEIDEDDKRVLDIGQGPAGRHVKALGEEGINAMGFDFVQKHSTLAKKANPERDIMVADWHNMPFKSDSVDVAYCLGRSFTHNTTTDDAIAFLRESRRVIKDDGKLIVDLPENTGNYFQRERNRLEQAAQKLGISHKELGSIIDSPDGMNFFDRLLPSEEQFKAMATISGFEAERIKERRYTDSEGHENVNAYYRLTPLGKTPSFDELMDAIHTAHTAHPPLYVTYI